MKRPWRIALTSGDQDGIGTEVTAKALVKFKPRRGVQFFLWRSPKCPAKHLRLIDSSFKRVTVKSWPEALQVPFSNAKTLVDINSVLSPAQWVETSAHAALSGHLDALTTAPLSKTAIRDAGFKDIGHTDILRRVCAQVTREPSHLFMGFIGAKFNVVLATGHIPLRELGERLSPAGLQLAIERADTLRLLLPKAWGRKPLALVGLNPHSGEQGLIGDDETQLFTPVIEKMRREGYNIDGPLVPDAAFLKPNWANHSVYVCPYHDQGLIPFKMIHGHSGVHITLGLPFVRTSVDHGTAKNLFGLNKANARSMTEAIDWAIRLCQKG